MLLVLRRQRARHGSLTEVDTIVKVFDHEFWETLLSVSYLSSTIISIFFPIHYAKMIQKERPKGEMFSQCDSFGGKT